MTANKMWGGRFTSGPAAIMEEINTSIGFDKRLAPQDLAGSQALDSNSRVEVQVDDEIESVLQFNAPIDD